MPAAAAAVYKCAFGSYAADLIGCLHGKFDQSVRLWHFEHSKLF